jgi:hypothetical protein
LVAANALVSATSGSTAAAASEPTIAVEAVDPVGQGPVTRLRLAGWPPGPVTVVLCGDEGRRASVDCDHAGARSAGVDSTGTALVLAPTGTPPIGCPCVYRASTRTNDVVRTLPVEISGVPLLTPDRMAPDPGVAVTAADLIVDARVESGQDQDVRAAFGFAVAGMLVLEIRNTGHLPQGPFTVSGSVGRDARSGEPLPLVRTDTVAPGDIRRIEIPFELDAPANGDYVVAGSLWGSSSPVRFDVSTTNRPWGWMVVPAMAALAVAFRGRRRPPSDGPGGAADDDVSGRTMAGDHEVNSGGHQSELAGSDRGQLLDRAP